MAHNPYIIGYNFTAFGKEPIFADGRLTQETMRWVNPFQRNYTKHEAPYCYSEFFLHGQYGDHEDADEANYSDRLAEWDRPKFFDCWEKHCKGHRWDNAGAARIGNFMSAYLGHKVKVVALAEGCNPSTGYPYWIVWTKKVKS